jgi:putative transposase
MKSEQVGASDRNTQLYQIWTMDISSISPLGRFALQIACQAMHGARLHLSGRRPGLVQMASVLSWRVSITPEADFCVKAVEDAPARHGKPEIFNTPSRNHAAHNPAEAMNQGSQFTSTDLIKVLASREIKISLDGKGAWRDYVFVERPWRTLKYEEVYLHAHASVPDARALIGRYLGLYNSRRPHSSLDGKIPDLAYFNLLMPKAVAA